MRVNIVKFGKIADDHYRQLQREYFKRLGAFTQIASTELKERESTSSMRLEQQGRFVVALDQGGVSLTSERLAQLISEWSAQPSIKELQFVVGGPYGLPEAVKERAGLVWSLSELIFPSDLAWLIAWEQIYRAYTIINRHSYHHGRDK